jgi:uncharacterized membrane protein YhiD involved in acid resistance
MLVCIGSCWFVLVHVGLYWFVLVHVGLYWFMLVGIGSCWFMLVHVGPMGVPEWAYSFILVKPEAIIEGGIHTHGRMDARPQGGDSQSQV